ncbi:hypothetical protein EMCG_09138 [[Emmonsia] crescens]|uniref:Uncharacterized protein n=1 Tax=[Emmonsia] crescens TaxID=73230 RepID=A0A0G2I2V3_9EURO|nr:hypothetical protein EMCG_09138 [Emmonsia crescens UAMH 3008]
MGYITESEFGFKIQMSKWRHHAIAIYTMFLEEKTAQMDDHENLMNKQTVEPQGPRGPSNQYHVQ